MPESPFLQSLPALLEELHNKLTAVDTLCVMAVTVPARPLLPVFTLAKLCDQIDRVRESIAELECYCA